jgi:hypothetical protein
MELKVDLRVNVWIFSTPNVMAVIILARNSQNYPNVVSTSQGGFWSHGT